MSITLLDPPTAAEIGLITKSTPYRVQFGVTADASGGALLISGTGFSPTTALKALMGTGANAVPFRALPLLELFSLSTGGQQTAAEIMQDVTVTSRTLATSSTAASAVPPCGYNLLGDVAGTLLPVIYIVAPATSYDGAAWSITIELRQSVIG